uniref:5'-tyrosyl-DNA phosphodiesterase n=1 Tax=Ditylenchus dipsaci TaxID=166011 RepID=A0A915DQS5_9BILA
MSNHKSNDEENIRHFAEITNTDETFAHAMLQDDNFDLQAALAKFFSGQLADDLSGDILEVASSTSTVKIQTQQITQVPPKKSSVVTMNSLPNCCAISHLKDKPGSDFLQEVTNDVIQLLAQQMEPMYNIFVSNPSSPSYCITLISKNIKVERHEILEFDTSVGRSAILIEAQWQKLKLKLINYHFDSIKENSSQRSKQFAHCINKLDAISGADPSKTLAIFGGDLNLRDEEVSSLPKSIKDRWIEADCIYYSGPYADMDFSLQGTQRIKQIYCFPSDHFGISCRFYNPPGQ